LICLSRSWYLCFVLSRETCSMLMLYSKVKFFALVEFEIMGLDENDFGRTL